MKKKKITFKTIMLIVFLLVFILVIAGTCKRKVSALELSTNYYSLNISSEGTKNGFIAIYNGEPSLGYPLNRAITAITATDYLALIAERTQQGLNNFSLYMNIEGTGSNYATYTKPHTALYTAFFIRYDSVYSGLLFEIYEINFDYLHGYNKVLKSSTNLFLSNTFQELYESYSGIDFRLFLSGLVGVWYTDKTNDYQTEINNALLQIQIGPIVENVENYVYTDGYNNGYTSGYNTGYTEGQAGENATPVVFAVLTGVFQALGAFLSIELLPHMTIGLFFALPLFFAVVGLILWIWRRH